jgi:hypothetical protein
MLLRNIPNWLVGTPFKDQANGTITFLNRVYGYRNGCTELNPLKAELNPICHLLALLGAHHILHISRIRVKLSF